MQTIDQSNIEYPAFQERIPTRELREGDFLYVVEATKMTGPRGGKYRFDGVRVDSKIEKCGYGLDPRRYSFGIRTRSNPAFGLPGNLADLTTAIIKKREV